VKRKLMCVVVSFILVHCSFAQTTYSLSSLAMTPTIDGDLSEWQDVEAITIDSSRVTDKADVTDDSDLSITAYLAKDESSLYFAADVADDVLVFERAGDTLYETDALEFWLGDKQFAASFTEGLPVVHQFPFSGEQLDLSLLEYAVVYTDTGYSLEVRVPLELLPSATEIAFAIGVDDADEEEGTAVAQLYYPEGWAWGDTTTYAVGTVE
jgi:Carbohydrate family 9 binding domain-like